MATYPQDVLFQQGSTTTFTLDLSQAAQSAPKRVVDYQGFSFHIVFSGSPKGTLQVQRSNAPVLSDKLIAPANWVTVDPLTLTFGGSPAVTSPTLIELLFNRAGWVSLLFTPGSGSTGSLTARFEGLRK